MRKIKEVLRLRCELALGQREIARACAISQDAVHNKRTAALFRDLNLARANGSLQQLLKRLNRIDSSGCRRLGHGHDVRTGAKRLLGDHRRPLPDPLDDPDFATAVVLLARADRRSYVG